MRRALAALAVAWALLPAGALAADTGWHPVGDAMSSHAGGTATPLTDGSVLLVGGTGFEGTGPGDVELYDPARRSFKAGPSLAPRSGQGAVRLGDGRVLVFGGFDPTVPVTGPPTPLASAAVYDPVNQAWRDGAAMPVGLIGATATLLADGRVLVAGGVTAGDRVVADAELYDPRNDRWTKVASMASPRLGATALLLPNHRVLVAGGTASVFNEESSLDTAELYDPAADRWRTTPRMRSVHAQAGGAVLPNGEAMIAGGFDFQGGFGVAVQTTDLYIPPLDQWRAAGPMVIGRGEGGWALLNDGSVLAVGGVSRQTTRASVTAERFDWRTRRWTLLPLLPDRRVAPLVAALKDGGALIVGGERSPAGLLYEPPTEGPPANSNPLLAAVGANLPLSGLTALLLLAIGAQALIRRRRQGWT